jgi:hypothetical protein
MSRMEDKEDVPRGERQFDDFLEGRRREMVSKIAAIGMVIGVTLIGGMVSSGGMVQTEPAGMPAGVQVIQPEIEILERPVIIEVQVEPTLGVDTNMMILCATSTYRGEAQVDRRDARVSLSISGEIRELSPRRIFVSFDVEARSEDSAGARTSAGSGAAILSPGEPKVVLTIGGRSVILTVRFTPEEAEPESPEKPAAE